MGFILGGGVYSGRRGIFWEGEVDSGNVVHSCRKVGIFCEGGVVFGKVAYRCMKGGHILEGIGRLWDCPT